ncbi:amidohydrolase family protein [Dictyobacter formicarum]|uniref:Amidohydrolase n=1 Tax=Dictyobacter formicarum TaxID=2778368 RepID=A0ABQ3V9V0_9CHLR|nr:amidohydrolase family protein [Dictyobacter formicarum]GHO82917.1 amidohydrolase [Dictyobacter formicarum]
MPDFPIIDTHVHLWDPERFRMSWLDNAGILNQRYALSEYHQHTQGVDIEGMVYVEVDIDPHYTLIEPKWVAEQARQDPRLRGIVAYAPIENGARVRAYLDELVSISPLIKGVRRLFQGEQDDAYCLRPEFVHGIQILPEYGLSFDICVRHTQLESVIELVRRCPGTAFILDHIAKPDIKDHLLDPWRQHIEALAAQPNVVCKISGMVTEADPEHWTIEDLAPYVAHVIAAFGEDRILYGGDWPVALHATSYPRWVETLDTLTAHLSPTARRKLWIDNARKFYRL